MEMNGVEVKKGSWTKEEDLLLKICIQNYGEGKWHQVPHRAGLNRCKKSCKLRWMNYLRPNIKRGFFTKDEIDLIIRLHKLLGNRWSLIAGKLPGRTANDVKNSLANFRRKTSNIIKPQTRILTKVDQVSEVLKTKDEWSDENLKKLVEPSSSASSSRCDEKPDPVMLACSSSQDEAVGHGWELKCPWLSQEEVDHEFIQWWTSLSAA